MKVTIENSTTVKPIYDPSPPPPSTAYIPLSAFDKVAYDAHVAIIYAYRPPAMPTATLKLGLQRVLAVYREWAGRLGMNHKGETVVLLNDQGVRFVEASMDSRLDQTLTLLKPSQALQSLYPSLKGIEELLQVQVTRFACGSMVIGFTAHHSVADGQATSSFLVAWGRVCRGLDIGPLPLHDRISYFIPRDPPKIEFDHFGAEYTSKKIVEDEASRFNNVALDDIVVHKVHFSADFLTKLKARASISCPPSDITNNNKRATYSTFECVIAHLWRAITKARSVSAYETTHLKISVNGRSRMNPRVPNQYFGNLVLWAVPSAKVKDLLREPVSHAAKLIHEAIAKVNDSYFRSFIDFTTSKVKHDPDIVTTASVEKPALCPDIEVDSWLRLPFCDLDFGCGSPYMFMPMYYPTEGNIFLLPSYIGDGSINAFVPVFKDQLDTFRQNCYILD
ncbi:agmatine hydroxycinnamoyltransferase 1-like [Punica granatum]|uniref:Uncharacterized protein n=2 Tax=Punica granatum TaxID=22663 RepID=A0A218WNZ2_PUNGR|nr:agmatine hydroxycinnamoyltransferase 1-like [Punica granatum]OWM73712.1 hypothetical protein CDL15_Pgr026816 [Punica granatum]PKI66035.1 hypothetical protein CRG98_013530 [Punica granatum]